MYVDAGTVSLMRVGASSAPAGIRTVVPAIRSFPPRMPIVLVTLYVESEGHRMSRGRSKPRRFALSPGTSPVSLVGVFGPAGPVGSGLEQVIADAIAIAEAMPRNRTFIGERPSASIGGGDAAQAGDRAESVAHVVRVPSETVDLS